MASIVPTMLLHFLRPWRSDGGGRAKQEARAESEAGARAESNGGSSCRRLQGKDCSYNPVAFPPSLEVRCRRYDSREGGGRAKQEPEPRATQGAIADDCRAGIVPTIPLHFLHPWRSDAGGRAMQEQLPSRRLMQCPGWRLSSTRLLAFEQGDAALDLPFRACVQIDEASADLGHRACLAWVEMANFDTRGYGFTRR